jgi:hypothetical protein
MRASQWVLGLATASAMVAAIAVGCGGSTSGGNATDSGPGDVTTDHVVAEAAAEAAVEAAVEAGPDVCTSDAMITALPTYDGSIPGSDASASVCISCVETACPNIVSECNAICGCPAAFIAFQQCVEGGGSFLSCGESDLLAAGLPMGDIDCAVSCISECGLAQPESGTGESGSTVNDAGDASSDATGQ